MSLIPDISEFKKGFINQGGGAIGVEKVKTVLLYELWMGSDLWVNCGGRYGCAV